MFKSKKETPKYSDLAKLTPFISLNEEQLILLATKAEIRSVKKGVRLLKIKDQTTTNLFVLEGSIECKDKNGNKFTIQGGSPSSKSPIAKIRPSLYEVTTTEASKLIFIEAAFTEVIVNDNIGERISLKDKIDAETSSSRKLFLKIYEDLTNNTLKLPSIPSVAFKVRKLIDLDTSTATEICRAINMDPAMAAKILKAANSPIYRGANKIETINQAVVRLGYTVTRQLVLSFALRDVFKIDSERLRIIMNDLWEHSLNIATNTYTLSKELKLLSPEEALLAGLIHDIGAIPIILYAKQYPNLLESDDTLASTINSFKGELGGIILKKWDFSNPMVSVAREAEHWERHADQPDYCDLVIVAQLYSIDRTQPFQNAPDLEQSPSFKRLGLDKISSDKLNKVFDKAKYQRDTIKGFFSRG